MDKLDSFVLLLEPESKVQLEYSHLSLPVKAKEFGDSPNLILLRSFWMTSVWEFI